ncbi:MAG TPA: GGDEF domain-containing protein, partial [Duganella sp.]
MTGYNENAYETLMQFLYRAPVALIQVQHDGAIEMLNPMASRLLMPLSPDGELDNLFDVLLPFAPDLRQLCADFQDEQGVVCEGKRIAVGEAHGHADSPAVLSLGLLKIEGKRLMAVLLDATQEVEREQRTLASRLARAARLDMLTQLPNRAGALEVLQSMANRPRAAEGDHCAALFVNLDRFKHINDAFGNDVGDQVIVLVAERLRATVRTNTRVPGTQMASEVAARVGGDEFAVLLDGLRDPQIAERIATRLLQRLSEPYRIGTHEIACTFSLGIAALDPASHDADDLLRDAALAMAVAKASGGDRFMLFQRQMRDQAKLRGGLEADLRVAIERGELFTVYQPVVGLLADGRVDR